MKRVVTTLLVAALMIVASTAAFAEYNQSEAVGVMRANMQSMRGLRGAIGTDNYLEVAKLFAVLAQGSRTLLEMDPPRGAKDEWDRINNALVDAALEGIMAAAAEDKDAIAAAQGKIGALNKDGHGSFK